jgi:hypothetical protein
MSNYNGWTNYATWRVNLELIADFADAMDLSDYEGNPADLAKVFENYIDEVLESHAQGIALDYARSFVAGADYFEMAVAALSGADLLEEVTA